MKTIEINIGIDENFDIQHAIDRVTDALYSDENVTQDEVDLVYHLLVQIKKQL
jgi:hypothetical protein